MEELVEQAKRGDKEAFTTLIVQQQAKLYRIARTRIQDENDIDDAIQETMIIMYQKLDKLKENHKFYLWVIRILINECNQIYRRKKKKIISFEEAEESLQEKNMPDINDKITCEEVLKILPKEDKTIMLLYYMNGYTTKEIGEILQIKENTIKSKLKRSREKIRERFGGELK